MCLDLIGPDESSSENLSLSGGTKTLTICEPVLTKMGLFVKKGCQRFCRLCSMQNCRGVTLILQNCSFLFLPLCPASHLPPHFPHLLPLLHLQLVLTDLHADVRRTQLNLDLYILFTSVSERSCCSPAPSDHLSSEAGSEECSSVLQDLTFLLKRVCMCGHVFVTSWEPVSRKTQLHGDQSPVPRVQVSFRIR